MRGGLTDVNKESNLFTLAMRPVAKRGPSSVQATPKRYVRGEENLGSFRPRSGSLVEEHQKQLTKHTYLGNVGRVAVCNIICAYVIYLQYEAIKQDLGLLEELDRAPRLRHIDDQRRQVWCHSATYIYNRGFVLLISMPLSCSTCLQSTSSCGDKSRSWIDSPKRQRPVAAKVEWNLRMTSWMVSVVGLLVVPRL
jgi:hypothetical protein